eukprot:5571008-Prymnesium_polylepis.1
MRRIKQLRLLPCYAIAVGIVDVRTSQAAGEATPTHCVWLFQCSVCFELHCPWFLHVRSITFAHRLASHSNHSGAHQCLEAHRG